MKNNSIIFTIFFAAAVPAFAGGDASFTGATEWTQIKNNIGLVTQYAKQVEQYIRQGLQLEAEIRNLVQNPASLLGPEIGNLINSTGELMSRGNSIGSSIAQIDRNFATTFKSPTAYTLSRNFSRWHQTNTDTLEGALKTVGLHREQGASDTRELRRLHDKMQTDQGAVQAAQTIQDINIEQIKQLTALKDLLATQLAIESTALQVQSSKEQARIDKSETIMGTGNIPLSKPGQSPSGI